MSWKSIVRKAIWKHNEMMLNDKIVNNYEKLEALKEDNFWKKGLLIFQKHRKLQNDDENAI